MDTARRSRKPNDVPIKPQRREIRREDKRGATSAFLRVSAVKSVLHHSASMILPFSCQQFSCLMLLSLLPFIKYFPVLFFSCFCQFLLVGAPLLCVHLWFSFVTFCSEPVRTQNAAFQV